MAGQSPSPPPFGLPHWPVRFVGKWWWFPAQWGELPDLYAVGGTGDCRPSVAVVLPLLVAKVVYGALDGARSLPVHLVSDLPPCAPDQSGPLGSPVFAFLWWGVRFCSCLGCLARKCP